MRRFNLRQISGLGKSLSNRQKITLGSVGSAAAIASFALITVNASNSGTSKPASTSTTIIETHSANDALTPIDNNASVNIQTESSTNTSNDEGVFNTSITVNGEQVTVPENGTSEQTINDGNSQTTVNVSNTTQGSATNKSESTTKIQVDSSSEIKIRN